MRLGALEAGGTKMVCAIGNEYGEISNSVSIPTTTPEETLPRIVAYFEEQGDLQALGIGAFGPVGIDPNKATYGKILDTPKLAWKHYDLLGNLQEALHIPMAIDTDVNAACLGEVVYGEAKGLSNVLYLTIGTGIGAGLVIDGKPVHGLLHPEAGHITVRPQKGDEGNCICPYHTNCFEGLASGPSLQNRYRCEAKELAMRKEVWELESEYIAQALLQYLYVVSPERMILGGGVMHQDQIFELVRKKVLLKNHGYISETTLQDLEHFIVPASLGGNQGIMGCLHLAKTLL